MKDAARELGTRSGSAGGEGVGVGKCWQDSPKAPPERPEAAGGGEAKRRVSLAPPPFPGLHRGKGPARSSLERYACLTCTAGSRRSPRPLTLYSAAGYSRPGALGPACLEALLLSKSCSYLRPPSKFRCSEPHALQPGACREVGSPGTKRGVAASCQMPCPSRATFAPASLARRSEGGLAKGTPRCTAANLWHLSEPAHSLRPQSCCFLTRSPLCSPPLPTCPSPVSALPSPAHASLAPRSRSLTCSKASVP